MAKVGLVFGGRSVEHLVSVTSARTVAEGLKAAGHEVVPLGVAEDGCFVGPEDAGAALIGERDALAPVGEPIASTLGRLIDEPLDVIFPIVHGTYGEDGTLQGLCAMLDIPCVGAQTAASAVAMDKVLAKRVLRDAGIPVVEGVVVSRKELEEDAAATLSVLDGHAYPLFVKPSVGGSSVGCRKVDARGGLEDAVRFALRFCDQVLVERAVVGREVECAVLGSEAEGFEASCLGEIVPGRDFYDYEDKYILDGAGLIAPAELDDALTAELQKTAVEAFRAIGGTGMARVDFFVEEQGGHSRLLLNEINTLPGFTRISMYPRLWGLSGKPLGALCGRLVELAVAEHAARTRLDEALRDWVAEIQRKSKPPTGA